MRSVLPADAFDLAMDETRRRDDARPELRKHKTMKTIDGLALDEASSPSASPSRSSRIAQFQRDYEMAQSILESRRRVISPDMHRRILDKAARSAPGGRPRVVLEADEDVRRSLRSASEAYLRDGNLRTPTPTPTTTATTSSSTDDSGSGKKKKKTVSFQDESSGSAPSGGSGSRRQNMDHARCLDDASGPGNGHATSPIHAACARGDHLVVAHLLSFYAAPEAAALVNSLCACGLTPLQVASLAGHAKVAKLLLKRQARVNKKDSSNENASLVVSSGGRAALLAPKTRERSCLALATARRSAELVELLLEYGAHVDEDALATAATLGDAAALKLLVQASQKKSGLFGAGKLFGAGSAPSEPLDAAWLASAAAVAVANDHPALLLTLLGDGQTPASRERVVHAALEATRLADYKLLRCLTKLYDHALLVGARDAAQLSLLHLAVKQASARCVTLLIRLGVDVNARDALGIAPLYMACARGQSSIAKLLLNAGAVCEAMGPNDETPLHIAAQENHLSCVMVLLSDGNAPVDGTTLDKCTALHLACQRGNTTVAKCLLDHGADVNARTVCDETPLLKASRMSNMETVKLLLARDAEIATSSTSSIEAGAPGGDYTHTASTSSSVFSTGSSVRSLDAEDHTTGSASSASSVSRRRTHERLHRLAAHQMPRRPSSDEEDRESDQIFMAKSKTHKSFKGWLKSVVKSNK